MPAMLLIVYWGDKTIGGSDDKQPRSASTYVKIAIPSRGEMVDNKISRKRAIKSEKKVSLCLFLKVNVLKILCFNYV